MFLSDDCWTAASTWCTHAVRHAFPIVSNCVSDLSQVVQVLQSHVTAIILILPLKEDHHLQYVIGGYSVFCAQSAAWFGSVNHAALQDHKH